MNSGIMSERADDERFARAIDHVAVLRTRYSEKSHYLEQLWDERQGLDVRWNRAKLWLEQYGARRDF